MNEIPWESPGNETIGGRAEAERSDAERDWRGTGWAIRKLKSGGSKTRRAADMWAGE